MRTLVSLSLLLVLLNSCSGTNSGCSSQNAKCPDNLSTNQTPVAGSASTVSTVENIRIITAEPDPRVCLYVNDTMGYSLANNLAQAQKEARQMMKENASAMGGNIIRLDTNTVDDPGMIERGQVVLNGRVFKCDMSISPEAVLGPLKQESTPPPGATPENAVGTPAPGAGEQRPATNPPSQPGTAFNEEAFLNAGENEFEG